MKKNFLGWVVAGMLWGMALGLGDEVQAQGVHYYGTAVNSSALGGVPANMLNNPFLTGWMQSNYLYGFSADLIPATNDGALITSFTDRGGTLMQGNGWYASDYTTPNGNGHPGIYFDGTGNNIFTNTTVLGGWTPLSALCTNACTIYCVFRQRYDDVSFSLGNNALFDGFESNGLLRAYFSPAYGFVGSSPAFQSYYPGVTQGTLQDTPPDYNLNDDIHVYCVSWNSPSNTLETYWDGGLEQNYPNGSSYSSTSNVLPIGFQGTLTFGQLGNSAWPCKATLYEFWIYANFQSRAVKEQTMHYFAAKYGLLGPVIGEFGDSITAGGVSSGPSGGWTSFLSTNFPGCRIRNFSIPGATIQQMVSNVEANAANPSFQGPKVAFLLHNGQNGRPTSAQYTNGLITALNCLKTNGWCTIIANPASDGYTDTNLGGLFKSAISSMITNCIYPNFANELANLGINPFVGFSNAWANTGYYPTAGYVNGTGAHGTNSWYGVTESVLVADVRALLYGNFTMSDTNAPPPTLNQQWTATDVRAPGIQFVSSNGLWEFYTPAGILP